MAYTLDRYFQFMLSNPTTTPRTIIYPNNTVAAKILNKHTENKSPIVKIAQCLPDNCINLPMPNVMLNVLDAKIQALNGRALVVGLDAYLALLDAEGITAFIFELQSRLDRDVLNIDYLLSVRNNPNLEPRYEEARKIISIVGNGEILEPFSILAYSDKWGKFEDIASYNQLFDQMSPYEPSGSYALILPGLTEKQAGIGNAVSFVLDPRAVAAERYGLDADLDDVTLEQLLSKSAENRQSPEIYLENLFGIENINTSLALKRLLEIPADNLWSAHIWSLRRRIPSNSYIKKVISGDVTHDNLLWKYVVDTAITVLSDVNAKKYAQERADSLKATHLNYEPLIVEFIGQTKDNINACQFLNCGAVAERVEIVRRVRAEDLSYGLPRKYGELFPTFADYFSVDFDYGDEVTTAYFKEYRRLKIINDITDDFVKRAQAAIVPQTYPARDTVLGELRTHSDIALLVVDAMGVEYMPLLLAMAKRCGMNIESQIIATTKLPTETVFNPIEWDAERILPLVKGVDNVVHVGAEKNETSTPERNFEATLRKFETTVMNGIANGLARFARVVVTADHGASRLAVIAHREGKSEDLQWNTERDGKPANWRYSLAPPGVTRPPELEQVYFPETKETYWIVRGYNRFPKMGGKLYELHGGATLEERLVPVVVFTRKAVLEVPKQHKITAEVVDEFEGLI